MNFAVIAESLQQDEGRTSYGGNLTGRADYRDGSRL
jgi:hypothetical protein